MFNISILGITLILIMISKNVYSPIIAIRFLKLLKNSLLAGETWDIYITWLYLSFVNIMNINQLLSKGKFFLLYHKLIKFTIYNDFRSHAAKIFVHLAFFFFCKSLALWFYLAFKLIFVFEFIKPCQMSNLVLIFSYLLYF